MQVKNHILTNVDVDTSIKSPNHNGIINPTLIVLHYTASGGADGKGDATYLSRASSRASAHVVVGRDGSIFQIVPFNRRAWHAGKSNYKGRDDVNDFSIGIEIDNWGWLDNGKSHTGEVVPPQFHFKGTRSGKSEWEAYREEQLKSVEEVIRAICDVYPIVDIVGHEDIAPGRKQDPGPALDDFKAKMKEKYVEKGTKPAEPKQSETKKETSNSRTTTTALRLRERPNTTSTVLTTLAKGRKVTVLKHNVYPGWDHVQVGTRKGYVANQYLD